MDVMRLSIFLKKIIYYLRDIVEINGIKFRLFGVVRHNQVSERNSDDYLLLTINIKNISN